MPYPDYNSYVTSVQYSPTWHTTTNMVGENVSQVSFAYYNASASSFSTTNPVYCFFNGASFLQNLREQDSIVYLEIQVNYELVNTVKEQFASVNIYPVLGIYKLGLNNELGYEPSSSSSDILSLDEQKTSGITTAIFQYDSEEIEIPDLSILIDSGFNIGIVGDVDNTDQNADLQLRVYDVKFIVYYRANDPLLQIYSIEINPEDQVVSGDTVSYGSISQNSVYVINFALVNQGTADFVIESPKNVTTARGLISSSCPPEGITIAPNSDYILSFDIYTGEVGTNTDTFTITSNDPINPSFDVTVSYSVVAGATAANLGFTYGLSTIANNASISSSSIAVDSVNNLTFTATNSGTAVLSITSVSVTGDGSKSGGTLVNGVSIPISGSKTLQVLLSTEELGNKTFTVTVISNDSAHNPYIFYVNYSVLPESNLEIKDEGVPIEDGDSVSLGSLDRGNDSKKTYILKNSGVSKSVIINSVSVTGDVIIDSVTPLPATLSPNNANAVTLIISFSTDESGLKSGNLIIDWDQSS